MPTTVLIVDDHPSFRASARAILEADGYEVVGEAEDGASRVGEGARARAGRAAPRRAAPGHGRLRRQLEVASKRRRTAVVLVSSREACDYGTLVAECGARGFIPKDELSGAALSQLLG